MSQQDSDGVWHKWDDVPKLLADNARLRALVKQAEWRYEDDALIRVCNWCPGWDRTPGELKHETYCPAFTVEGNVK